MIKVRELERLNHESVGELKRLLDRYFDGLFISFQIHYFLGEDEVGTRVVVFSIFTNIAGEIYSKVVKLQRHENVLDIEEKFISEVLEDLFISGVTFLHTDKVRSMKLSNKGPVRTVHFHNYLN